MKLEKLMQQKAALESQIARVEFAEKNKAKVEKLVMKILQKYPDLFYFHVAVLEKPIEDAFSTLAENLTNQQA